MMESEQEVIPLPDLDREITKETVSNDDDKSPVTETYYENTGFVQDEQTPGQEELPPLTYVDFMPRCLSGAYLEGKQPEFAEFKTVLEQANQWLEAMTQYHVWKCETIQKKLLKDSKVNNDAVFYHMSSHGSNTFVTGLRLWVMPKQEPDFPVQKLSYITVLPDHASGNVFEVISDMVQSSRFHMVFDKTVSSFDSLTTTVEKLNRLLQTRPLPGKILSAETFVLKVLESLKTEKPDTENTCWSEIGKSNRLYIYALRIFYMIGQSAYETIGIHDVVPDYVQNSEGLGVKVKFAPFPSVVKRANQWLKDQEGLRVINVQSVDIKCDKKSGGQIDVNTNGSGYGEMSFSDSQFLKILRIFYIKEHKSDRYKSLNLTSRLFVPVRHSPRNFETFSKTMQRVISWINATKMPVFGVETVDYQVNPDSYGTGVQDNRVNIIVSHNIGRYVLTCIRLYFPSEFSEPPPEVLQGTAEDEAGWACVVS